ncbi:uncharacterized protein LOC131231254 isoform X1 [Magnolia sinica]|uniref:uncharacterized protein LOC131231254 isoform X1 n=1 Tax=Magnolia sinica TaxID=86752 RepID=UPI0026595FE4|nr:uncharacterized protein LOC131231254 isoform X1 [Magnolia sinica]
MTKKSEVCSDFFIHKFERKVGSVIDGSLRCWKRKRRMFLTLSSLATRTDREERGSGIRHFLLDKRTLIDRLGNSICKNFGASSIYGSAYQIKVWILELLAPLVTSIIKTLGPNVLGTYTSCSIHE